MRLYMAEFRTHWRGLLSASLGLAAGTISNYVNHLAHTPKESFMADPTLAWVAPRNR